MTERFRKKMPLVKSSQYIIEQFEKCKELSQKSPEASLLLLGRIAEYWLMSALNLTNKPRFTYLTGRVRNKDLINDDDKKMFDNISKNYNFLKHWTTYEIEDAPLKELIDLFDHFIKNRKNNQEN